MYGQFRVRTDKMLEHATNFKNNRLLVSRLPHSVR